MLVLGITLIVFKNMHSLNLSVPVLKKLKSIRVLGVFFLCFLNFQSFSGIDYAQLKQNINTTGFEENKGQVADEDGNLVPFVLFRTTINKSVDLYVTKNGLTYVFKDKPEQDEKEEFEYRKNNGGKKSEKLISWYRVDMDIVNASIDVNNIVTEFPQGTGEVNYYLAHCPNGALDVKTYKSITIRNIYPGIDWVLKADAAQGVKHDFVVHPGANPSAIKLQYKGGSDVKLIKNNSAVLITTPLGELEEGKLVSYQHNNSEIISSYKINEDNTFGFAVGKYDKSKTLVIDPPLQLVWATYYGGSNLDGPEDIGIDAAGNIYISGYVSSVNFPKQNPGGGAYYQGSMGSTNWSADAFIVKFNNAGVRLWATYYGGDADDRGEGIATDLSGNVYIAGSSASSNMPVLAVAGAYNQATVAGANDAIVLKFSSTGQRLWATYLGGPDNDKGASVACDAAGNVVVTGFAGCNNFPVVNPGGGAYFQNVYAGGICVAASISGDVFVTKFNSNGACIWSTLLGSRGGDVGNDIITDAAGNIFVTGVIGGRNAFPFLNPGGTAFFNNAIGGVFITKFSPSGVMLWSTAVGGGSAESITCDESGNVILVGGSSWNYPTLNPGGTAYYQAAAAGSYDAFITKFTNTGTMLWSTYYGGTGEEYAKAVVTDYCGNIYITGYTKSNDLPVLNGGGTSYYDATYGGGWLYGDLFIAAFKASGQYQWGTYYGGGESDWGEGIVIDKKGSVFVVGEMKVPGANTLNPGGGAYYQSYCGGNDDGLLLKFVLQSPLVASINYNNVTCFGQNNGVATVNVISGLPAYTYSWSNTQTTQTATALTAGTYTAIVNDDNCLFDTLTVTITEPPLLQAFVPVQVNVGCNGGNNGSAFAAALGGTVPYTYSWSNGQSLINNTGLSAGTYTVTISDANNCTATQTVTITQPLPLAVNLVSKTDVDCNGNNTGTINVSASGGIQPYQYSWNTTQTGATVSLLVASTYTVIVTDANNCTATYTTSITEPPVLSLNVSTNDAHCNLPDGSASVIAAGGAGGYMYSWTTNPVQSTSLVTGIPAGTYTLVVTDSRNCTKAQTITINNLPGPIISASVVKDVLCNGNCDGIATVNVNGGTMPYGYLWNTTVSQLTQNATGLCAGNYSVTVTDASGCTGVASVTVAQPPLLNVSVNTQTNVNCNGGNNGLANAVATGGVLSYSFLWSNAQTNTAASSLIAGTYTIVVSDANNCTALNTVTITQPLPLSITLINKNDVNCNGNNTGTINVSAAGGIQPYQYSWSNTQTGNTASSLVAAGYTVVVTDANNCTATSSFIITEPAALSANINISDAHCNLSDGAATVIPSGGTAGYTYSWTTVPVQQTATANNIPAGTYSVTITDANNCSMMMVAVINNLPGAVLTTSVINNVTCNGLCDGAATVNANGGVGPYTYLWNTAVAQQTQNATGMCAGNYTVTVTDASGCTSAANVSITQPLMLLTSLNSQTDVTCNGGNDGAATVIAVGGTGTYLYSWNTVPSQNTASANNLSAGNYAVTVTDANNCTSVLNIVITQPAPLQLIINGPATICAGANAQIAAVAAGGTANYIYSWPGGFTGTTFVASPNMNTVYTVSVTDSKGCTATSNYSLTVNQLPDAAFSANDSSGCAPLCVTFTGSTANIVSYAWDFGDGSSSAAGAPIQHCYNNFGAYSVKLTVTDANGCSNNVTYPGFINVYPTPKAGFVANPLVVKENSTVNFTDKSTGAFAYLWSFGDAGNATSTLKNPQFIYTDTGTYSIQQIVINEFGCADTAEVAVKVEVDVLIFIANTFTPNGDNKNDYFFPVLSTKEVDKFEFYIYDRWGDLIFESNDINKYWDGRANGGKDIAQQDTYVWKLNIRFSSGERYQQVGSVNLVR